MCSNMIFTLDNESESQIQVCIQYKLVLKTVLQPILQIQYNLNNLSFQTQGQSSCMKDVVKASIEILYSQDTVRNLSREPLQTRIYNALDSNTLFVQD